MLQSRKESLASGALESLDLLLDVRLVMIIGRVGSVYHDGDSLAALPALEKEGVGVESSLES